MLSSFFSRNSRSVPLPPLDPPPSPEKRLEKEKAWLATISNKKPSSRNPVGHRQQYPAPVEHIKKPESSGTTQSDGLLRPDARTYGGHTRNSTGGSSKSGDNNSKHGPSSIRSGFSSLRIGSSSSSRKAQPKDTPAPQRYLSSPVDDVVSPISSNFVHIPLPSPNSYLSASNVASTSTHPHHANTTSSARALRAIVPPQGGDYLAAKQSSHAENTKTLAERLQELDSANRNGLLDDEEYRVLRQNLFEMNLNSETGRPGAPEASGASREKSEKPVERTGPLLQIPRLNVEEKPLVTPPANPQGSEPLSSSLLLPPSSNSIRSKTGRVSLRSSKSVLIMRSTRLSSIFRRAASTPASESLSAQATNDSESVASMPASILRKGSRRTTTKAPIPKDWKELQEVHKKEHERETSRERSRSVEQDMENGTSEERPQKLDRAYRTMRSRGDSILRQEEPDIEGSSMRGALSNSRSDPALSDYLRAGSSLPTIPSPSLGIGCIDPMDQAASSRDVGRLRSDSRLITTSHGSGGQSQQHGIGRDPNFSVTQAADENLDSSGLKKAIDEVQSEKTRLIAQFTELEKGVLAKHGVPATTGRRGSLVPPLSSPSSAQDAERRRMSVSSSSIYSGTPGLGASSRTSMVSPSSGPTLSRRPSKASSMLSSSSSTRAGSQGNYSYRPPSMLAEEQEDLFLEGLVAEEGGDVTGAGHHDRETCEIRARRQNVEEKYQARIEYLAARLKSQLLKEKLRR